MAVKIKKRQIEPLNIGNTDIDTISSDKITDIGEFIRRDGTVEFTGDQSMGGNEITEVGTPLTPYSAARLVDIQNSQAGYKKWQSLVATTADITLANLQTIDVIDMVDGSKVLVKNQIDKTENGLWIVKAGQAWVRADDTIGYEMFVIVQAGAENANTAWVLSGDQAIEIGVTELEFIQFFGLDQITAGDGLLKTGNRLDVILTDPTRLIIDEDNKVDLAEIADVEGTYGDEVLQKVPVLEIDKYGRTIVASEYTLPAIPAAQVNSDWEAVGTVAEILRKPNITTIQEIITYINNYITNLTVNSSSKILSGGIAWVDGWTYKSTDIIYQIMGLGYGALATIKTLTAADPSLSRIDLFYVDIYGNLEVAEGTPAENPTSPILTANQLEVMMVLLPAGASEPIVGGTIKKIFDENTGTPTEWVATKTEETFTAINFNATTLPQNGTKYANLNINATATPPTNYIGKHHEGGIIFYLTPGSNGLKGLIAAETDTGLDFWGRNSGYSSYTTGATDIVIGTGQSNTNKMLALPAAASWCAKFCNDLIVVEDGVTYSDWYMPSLAELFEMWNRRIAIGGMGNKMYWSSTEVGWNKAYAIPFSWGMLGSYLKNNNYSVRAIRSFDNSAAPVIGTYSPVGTSMIFTGDMPCNLNGGILSMDLNSSKEWQQNTLLLFETWLGTVKTGTITMSKSTNLWGYKPDEAGWQLVVIPMYNFAPTADTFDKLVIRPWGSWTNIIDFDVDNIRFQVNGVITPPTTFAGLLDDIKFEFRDIEAGTAQVYDLDIDSTWKYTIEGCWLETDNGTLTGVKINIESTSVAALDDITVGTSKGYTTSAGLKTAVEHARVTLVTTTGYTGSPTLIKGKLVLKRI